MDENNNAAAIIEFAEDRTKPILQTFRDPANIAPDVVAIIGRDSGGATELLAVDFDRDSWRDRPRRRKGSIRTTTLESFIALTNRQSGEGSVIFADDSSQPKLVAVLNFHGHGADGDPEFCDDRIEYAFPLSDEWKAWMVANGKPMEQAFFAEWIENRLFDIGEPGAAGAVSQKFANAAGVELAGPQALRGLSKGLAIRVEHRVAKTVNLQSGEGRIEYSEEHRDEGGGPLRVPAAFHIMIPVFRGGPMYSIPVRLRYRTGGGKIQWFFEIHRADLFLLDALNDALVVVKRDEEAKDDAGNPTPGCGLSVFMGAPPV
jgi:uncharacterized protein YfdQ (DUF2303 family)